MRHQPDVRMLVVRIYSFGFQDLIDANPTNDFTSLFFFLCPHRNKLSADGRVPTGSSCSAARHQRAIPQKDDRMPPKWDQHKCTCRCQSFSVTLNLFSTRSSPNRNETFFFIISFSPSHSLGCVPSHTESLGCVTHRDLISRELLYGRHPLIHRALDPCQAP